LAVLDKLFKPEVIKMNECSRQWIADLVEQKIKCVKSLIDCDCENIQRCIDVKLNKLEKDLKKELLDYLR
jgi:hypothetical protein